MTMVMAEVSLGLCGLETSGSPPPVLRQGGAEQGPFARSSQARGRGRPRRPGATSTGDTGAGAGVESQGRAQGSWPRRACACAEAVRFSLQSVRLTRSAHACGRNLGRAKAVWRLNLEYTARAH
jgi:hypothetical protein